MRGYGRRDEAGLNPLNPPFTSIWIQLLMTFVERFIFIYPIPLASAF